MDNNMNYQQNGYQTNYYQPNGYQSNGYSVNGYVQSGYQKKKVDVKGLIITILCLITSLITAFSVLMPVVKMGAQSVNIIDLCKKMPEIFEELELDKFGEVIAYVYSIVAFVMPIIIAIAGLVFSIVLIVKLASVKFTGKELTAAKSLLKLEMAFSAFSIIYAATLNLYVAGAIGMSVAWVLPVIMCVCVIVISSIVEFVFKLGNKKDDSKYVISSVLAIFAIIFSAIIYISFGFARFTLSTGYSEAKWDFAYELYTLVSSFVTPEFYWEGERASLMVWTTVCIISTIVITIFASATIKKNIKAINKEKYPGVMNIVTGAIAIVLDLVELIMGKIVISDIDEATKVKFGTAGFLYIILGALLIVIGIVQVCVKNSQSNKRIYGNAYGNGVAYPNGMQYQNYNQNNGYMR